MAKNLLLMLFLCMISFFFNSIFASNTPRTSDACDAPAPDNFRVTSRGPDFISLAWDPAWDGATHTLRVLITSNSVDWVPLDSFYNLPGSSFTINDIEFTAEIKLVLSTNCSSGETSSYHAVLMPKIILELISPGRIPVNPVPVSCENIVLSEHEWVGFKVNRQGGGFLESNLFELQIEEEPSETHIKIMRVSDKTVIYAVDDENNWPPPTISTNNPFRIIEYVDGNNNIDIGYVEVNINFSSPSTVRLCQYPNRPWNNVFNYSVYVAETVLGDSPIPGGPPTNHSISDSIAVSADKTIRVQNPFTENLNIFMAQSTDPILIRLLTFNNQIILEQEVKKPIHQLLIPTEKIPEGIYILQIKTANSIQAIKIIKFNG